MKTVFDEIVEFGREADENALRREMLLGVTQFVQDFIAFLPREDLFLYKERLDKSKPVSFVRDHVRSVLNELLNVDIKDLCRAHGLPENDPPEKYVSRAEWQESKVRQIHQWIGWALATNVKICELVQLLKLAEKEDKDV